ncbi:hypothetical protein PPERSA_00042 [Pseudocohnilembus persalinus]|uniref:Uncharacterized protein n=1 Tax=Pseudocohnilembus persalinus TaxID=266149 RepID=A0A0V0Q8M8_PSEPJ|nr:hypothetical protein PPERSA_00042 [Pseudocohnilembus persalinus]|eukprot:KRW98550.1 hypothetical protein PPERSA_00042 [Pseudocohnilembus persalinus]
MHKSNNCSQEHFKKEYFQNYQKQILNITNSENQQQQLIKQKYNPRLKNLSQNNSPYKYTKQQPIDHEKERIIRKTLIHFIKEKQEDEKPLIKNYLLKNKKSSHQNHLQVPEQPQKLKRYGSQRTQTNFEKQQTQQKKDQLQKQKQLQKDIKNMKNLFNKDEIKKKMQSLKTKQEKQQFITEILQEREERADLNQFVEISKNANLINQFIQNLRPSAIIRELQQEKLQQLSNAQLFYKMPKKKINQTVFFSKLMQQQMQKAGSSLLNPHLSKIFGTSKFQDNLQVEDQFKPQNNSHFSTQVYQKQESIDSQKDQSFLITQNQNKFQQEQQSTTNKINTNNNDDTNKINQPLTNNSNFKLQIKIKDFDQVLEQQKLQQQQQQQYQQQQSGSNTQRSVISNFFKNKKTEKSGGRNSVEDHQSASNTNRSQNSENLKFFNFCNRQHYQQSKNFFFKNKTKKNSLDKKVMNIQTRLAQMNQQFISGQLNDGFKQMPNELLSFLKISKNKQNQQQQQNESNKSNSNEFNTSLHNIDLEIENLQNNQNQDKIENCSNSVHSSKSLQSSYQKNDENFGKKQTSSKKQVSIQNQNPNNNLDQQNSNNLISDQNPNQQEQIINGLRYSSYTK